MSLRKTTPPPKQGKGYKLCPGVYKVLKVDRIYFGGDSLDW